MGRRAAGPKRVLGLLLAAAVSLSLVGCTDEEGPAVSPNSSPEGSLPTEVVDRLDAAVSQAIELSGSTGAIAGVWAPWAGTWEASPGITAPSGDKKMSTDMHFRIGTNTKAMTCTVLLKLVDQKIVGLDDEITDYLKDTPGIKGMTFRQLCQNTGGIGDYAGALKSQFVNNPTRVWPTLELLSSGLPLNRTGEPGGAFASSNTGFTLLGMALKSVTGMAWPDLYQKYVLDPLGMTASSYPAPNNLKIPNDHPDGFAYQLGEKNALQCDSLLDETLLSPSMYGVAGGAISTMDDAKKLVEAVAAGALLTPESSAAQWQTVPVSEDGPEWQGYGLGIEQLGPLRGSAGEIPGFLSVMLSDPSSGLTVVVALNNSSAGAGFARVLGRQLAAIVTDAPVTISGAKEPSELPWTEEDAVGELGPMAVCQPDPDSEETEKPKE